MKKIGLFYGAETVKTAKLAKQIQEAIGVKDVELVPIETAWIDDFEKYENIIIGTSTWFDGELPDYWAEMVPALEDLKMKNKRIAIFGLGDQVKYPDNFADGIGILAKLFESAGAKLYGFTSSEGYTFTQSKALKDGQFIGLVIDIENQSDKTKERISHWVEALKKDFR